MKILFNLLFAMLICSNIAMAQSKQLIGTVINAEDGKPLVGVGILVKHTKTGTSTDRNGNFRLGVPADSKSLVFIASKFSTQQVDIKPHIDIKMVPADYVVVVAHDRWPKEKRRVTKAKDIQMAKPTTKQNKLQKYSKKDKDKDLK